MSKKTSCLKPLRTLSNALALPMVTLLLGLLCTPGVEAQRGSEAQPKPETTHWLVASSRAPHPPSEMLPILVEVFDRAVFSDEPTSEILPEVASKLAVDAQRRWLFLSLNDGEHTAKVLRGVGDDLLQVTQTLVDQVVALREQGQTFVGYKVDLGVRLFARLDLAPDSKATMERSLFALGFVESEPAADLTLLAEEVLARTLIDSDRQLRLSNLFKMPHWTPNQVQRLKDLVAQPEIDLFRLDTRGAYSDGQRSWLLYRGHRRFSASHSEGPGGESQGDDLAPAALLSAARAGGDYLGRALDAEGRFVYAYWPKTDEAKPSYNILRHAGTTYSLLELYEATGEAAYLNHAERALGYLRRQIQDCAIDAALACVVEGAEVKLGGNALAMLAFEKHIELTGRSEDRALLERLGGYLLAEQAEDGEFRVHKRRHPTGEASSFVSGYYPGEALLALLRHPDGDAEWLDAAERGAEWLITVRDGRLPTDRLAHDHWLLYALNELHAKRPQTLFLDHGGRIAEAILRAQNVRPAFPDWYGSFYIPPRSTPTATRAEGLGAAYQMLLRSDRQKAAVAALDAMKRAVVFDLGTQFDEVRSLYLPHPPKARGGFSRGLQNYEIRIDYVQHNISALLALRRLDPRTATQSFEAKPPNLMVISWDGSPDWVIDRLLDEGRLPNLQRMVTGGVRAEYSLPPFPSKTAVGHATLWTGCWPGTHGVTDNTVLGPGEKPSILSTRRGFESEVLQSEPLYMTAALAGRDVSILSATHSFPSVPHLKALEEAGRDPKKLRIFSGFEHTIAPGQMFDATGLTVASDDWDATPPHRGPRRELSFDVGKVSFHALIYQQAASKDTTPSFDRVLVRRGSRRAAQSDAEAVLVPREANDGAEGWSAPFKVTDGTLKAQTLFRLFALSGDGSDLALYQWKPSALLGNFEAADLTSYLEHYPAFHDQAFGLYARGNFGIPLMMGGSGDAEQRLLELVRLDTQMLIDGLSFAVETWAPDVLFHYSPMSDDAGHMWMGLLADTSDAYDPEMAAKIWPIYSQVFAILDDWLGAILQLAGDDTVVALVTDHGMTGIDRTVSVNTILAQAGLLTLRKDGTLDLSRTQILAADSDFFLRVNDQRYAEGIVQPGERPEVLKKARQALLDARDPETGAKLLSQALSPEDAKAFGVACPGCGDLFLDPAPGYYPRRRPSRTAAQAGRSPWGQGTHGFWPSRREMHAIFYLYGPGVRYGVEVPPIRHIDVAPTLARLVGLPPPEDACGTVIEAAITEALQTSSEEANP